MSQKKFKIYAIKHLGEVIYIGQTGDSVDARFWKHMHCAVNDYVGSRIPKLHAHIRENKAKNYTFEMLEVVESGASRSDRERYWISFYGTQDKCNTTAGGISPGGREHYKSLKVQCVKSGEVFTSMREAADARGVSVATVCLHANGKRDLPQFKFIT